MLRIMQRRVIGSLGAQCGRMMSNGPTDAAIPDDESDTNTRRRGERGLNKVTLIGRVGREPERRGSTEHSGLVFPLATTFNYKTSSGDQMTKTDWHRICVFRPGLRDNIASRIERGDRLFIEGSLSYLRYTDAENRQTNITSVIADNIIFLTHRQNPGSRSQKEDEEL